MGASLKVVGNKNSEVSEATLGKLKAHSVVVTDPNESTATTAATAKYQAYDGREVLDAAFGGREAWSKSKSIVFECADSYKPTLASKDFLEGGFYFAFAKDGSKDFRS